MRTRFDGGSIATMSGSGEGGGLRGDELLDEDSPFRGLLRAVEDLELEGKELPALAPDLAALKTRLPAELLDEDSIFAGRPERLAELREEVKELLLAVLSVRYGKKDDE